jgi:CheY-like chemotaxis protein
VRVLIADDSKAMRMIVLRTLRQSGLPIDDVHEAEDGAQALEAVASFGPDLILSDWNMPNMTGIEFLNNLRAAGQPDPVRVRDVRVEPGDEGAGDRRRRRLPPLTKPFDAERLAEVVGAGERVS